MTPPMGAHDHVIRSIENAIHALSTIEVQQPHRNITLNELYGQLLR